jgi:hypothetical protein
MRYTPRLRQYERSATRAHTRLAARLRVHVTVLRRRRTRCPA